MNRPLRGGIDIAMKVPPRRFDATIAFSREVVGLEPIRDREPTIGFELGPNHLWIDVVPGPSQAEACGRTREGAAAARRSRGDGVPIARSRGSPGQEGANPCE